MEKQLLAVAVLPVPVNNAESGKAAATAKKPRHVGWVIYCPDTQEFVCRRQGKETTYTQDPGLAHCYSSGYLATRDSSDIDVFSEVVPSFDDGEKISIAPPDDFYGCLCIITARQSSNRMWRKA